MRNLALALVFFTLSVGAFAQTSEIDISCKAPVSLEDKACVDMLGANVSGSSQGSMEQRDDGYYVFVPRAWD